MPGSSYAVSPNRWVPTNTSASSIQCDFFYHNRQQQQRQRASSAKYQHDLLPLTNESSHNFSTPLPAKKNKPRSMSTLESLKRLCAPGQRGSKNEREPKSTKRGFRLAHLVPVLGHLRQPGRLADVDEVQDVLLEARAAEPNGGVQELVPDAGVIPQSSRHLRMMTMMALSHQLFSPKTTSRGQKTGEMTKASRPKKIIKYEKNIWSM